MDSKSQSNVEETEFVDKTQWVPHGNEIVPAAVLLKGHVISIGSRYATTETSIVDKLLINGRIDDSHHFIASRIMNLLRLGTSKQNYATMQLFATGQSYDNSDFCPMTVFLKITRNLKKSQLPWIRAICGLQFATYEYMSKNSDLLKDSLEFVEEQLYLYEESLKEVLEPQD